VTASQSVLATMPLHAITAMYGEQGLRDRFALEAAAFTPADRARVSAALELAGRLHGADRRQREPYVNHPIRVAIRIISHYQVRDADIACAALLHDAVEDHADQMTASGSREDAFAFLGSMVGARAAGLVAAVTNPLYAPGADKNAQYLAHVTASLERHLWARVLKVSDFTDNGGGIIYITGPKAAKIARKYAPVVPVLADFVARPDTPLAAHVKTRILRHLDTAGERIDAIIAGSGPWPTF
jgi:(p)ppGpp synthase/HD superfamily hydrolase